MLKASNLRVAEVKEHTHVEAEIGDVNTLNMAYKLREHLQDAHTRPFDCLLQVCIVEDDSRALAAQLESNGFQISLCRCFKDFSSRESTSSEPELGDLRVRCHSSAGSST